jgi:hypothetical protein
VQKVGSFLEKKTVTDVSRGKIGYDNWLLLGRHGSGHGHGQDS